MLGVSSPAELADDLKKTSRLVQVAIVSGLLAAIAVLALMLAAPGRATWPSRLGDWAAVPRHYHFSVKFVFDRLSVPFAILSFVARGDDQGVRHRVHAPRAGLHSILRALCDLRPWDGGDGFGRHDRDPVHRLGAGRALLVGTSGRLFPGAPAPARNGLWVWTIYRVSDAALVAGGRGAAPPPGRRRFRPALGGRAVAL